MKAMQYKEISLKPNKSLLLIKLNKSKMRRTLRQPKMISRNKRKITTRSILRIEPQKNRLRWIIENADLWI